MRARGAGRLAWTLWGVALALTVVFITLVVADRGTPGPLEYAEVPLLTALYVGLVLLFSSVGAPVAARRPANAIGWLFCGTGIALAAGFTAQLYADRALINEPGGLPWGAHAAWASSWLLPFGLFVSPVFLLFLFPDGRPASRRWAIVVWAGVVIVVLGLLAEMFKPAGVEPFGIKNPLALEGAAGRLARFGSEAFTLSAIPFLLLGTASLIGRMRRSRGDERQQLKWFAYVASVMGVFFALAFVASQVDAVALADVFFLLGAIALALLPVACGIAILKYRLYDIDVLINRTLVYGALTAILATAYSLIVTAAGTLLRGDSELVTAAATLGVAALFRPLRQRVQRFIDRRFYRRKYDAARTVEAFAGRLRDEVDLDAMRRALLGVVDETMQPRAASVWLRSG